MSKAIDAMFQTSLDQALREERQRADRWKQETENIDIVHLLCNCGKPFKEKLLTDLLIASSISFENFMLHFFCEHPGESQRVTEIIRQRANIQKEHPSVVLLEYLATTDQIFTVKDIVDSLEYAYLFRIIAGFKDQSVQALKEHVSSSKHLACCVARSKRGSLKEGNKQIELRGLPLSSHSSGSGTNKAYRGIVLLTFMNDGRKHAMEVKSLLEMPSEKGRRSYLVYTLSDFRKYIIENFTRNIVWIMSQVDFVVPILTEGYFQMLDEERNMDDTGLDEKYAPYVVQVLIAEWASSFKNKRLRSLKPQGVKWPSKPIYPPFYTYVDKPSALPSILIKSNN